MAQAVVLILATVTSTGALLIGTRALGLRWNQLRPAVGSMLECVGMTLIFLAANLALGLVAILVGRSLIGAFVSTYSINDVALVGVSCFQGLAFHCWREFRSRASGSGVGGLGKSGKHRAGDAPEGSGT